PVRIQRAGTHGCRQRPAESFFDWFDSLFRASAFPRHAFFRENRLDAILALAMVCARLARPQPHAERPAATRSAAIRGCDWHSELLHLVGERSTAILACLSCHSHSASQRLASHKGATV